MALFKKRKPTFDDAGDELLKKINGKLLKYVVERTQNDGEVILGRDGRIIVNEREIAILCEGREVFCCPLEELKCGELLNLQGVRIQGAYKGRYMTLVAYYQSKFN